MAGGPLYQTIRGFAYADEEIGRLSAKVAEATDRREQAEADLVELLERLEGAGLPPRIAHGSEVFCLALRNETGEHFVEVLPFIQSYDVESRLAAAIRRDTVLEPVTVADV